jgi:hypothetical protein
MALVSPPKDKADIAASNNNGSSASDDENMEGKPIHRNTDNGVAYSVKYFSNF